MLTLTLATVATLALAAEPTTAPADPCGSYLYIPPAVAPSVVFYHSFSQGPDRPEINRLGARVSAGKVATAEGLTGRGYRPGKTKTPIRLQKLAWPLNKPITASMWWRLDEPMKPDSGFHLLSLRANGYLSNFVRGRGQWCALTRPTFVFQAYNFPGISNVNGIRFGDAWMTENVWHHVAMTVSAGSRVCVYWDGRLRSEVNLKGRLLRPDDVIGDIDLGPHWLGHPMTVDEILLLTRALSAEEVKAYHTAVRMLAAARFPFRQRQR
jgi:hypothetical protein